MINKSVLIWAGYYDNRWNATNWIEGGINDSEYSIIKLAYKLQSKGYDVTVAGNVKSELLWGVKWVNEDILLSNRGPRGLNEAFDLRVKDHYNILIGCNYIHFIRHLEDVNISFDKAYFWMHQDGYYPWYKGNELNQCKDYFKHPKLKAIIGISKTHAKTLKKSAKNIFHYTPLDSNKYIHFITHPLDLKDNTESQTPPLMNETLHMWLEKSSWDLTMNEWISMFEN